MKKENSENPKEKTAPSETSQDFKYIDLFRFHHFLSISKIKNVPYKEWVGETKNDEIVIINYKQGSVIIGAGENEIKARQNMRAICETRDTLGLLRHDLGMDIYKVNDMLKLEWVFPDGYLEE